MYWEVGTVRMGALASYGVSYRAIGRQSATYVQRVLLGAKPGDLPVERIDRFHLALNLKTAKALGVTIPKAVLDRADAVVQCDERSRSCWPACSRSFVRGPCARVRGSFGSVGAISAGQVSRAREV